MSVRLDYVQRARGTYTCQECGRIAQRQAINQKCCKRRTCREKRQRRFNVKGKRKVLRPTLDWYHEPLPPPQCVCGAGLKFGSDPMTGESVEYCPHCGERPLRLQGTRSYDQRERLEAELRAKQDRAEAPVDEGARERSKGRTQSIAPLRWGAGLQQGEVA